MSENPFSYRQLPLIVVVDLWLVLEFFHFLMFGFMSLDFRQLRLGVFLALVYSIHEEVCVWRFLGCYPRKRQSSPMTSPNL